MYKLICTLLDQYSSVPQRSDLPIPFNNFLFVSYLNIYLGTFAGMEKSGFIRNLKESINIHPSYGTTARN